MITVEISGGLGNQMYKFATGYAVAKRVNQDLSIDTAISDHVDFRDFGLDFFKLSYVKRITYYRGKRILDRIILNQFFKKLSLGKQHYIMQGDNPYKYDEHIFDCVDSKGDFYLYGGWANYKYFDDIKDSLKVIFTPKKIDEEVRSIVSMIKNSNSVAIHIRGGDYLGLGVNLSKKYYVDVLQKLRAQPEFKTAEYYIFSDDKQYANCILQGISDIKYKFLSYCNENTTILDMYLMSKCKTIVTANSTYSWWAAYLADENTTVFAPKMGIWSGDMYPAQWNVVEV